MRHGRLGVIEPAAIFRPTFQGSQRHMGATEGRQAQPCFASRIFATNMRLNQWIKPTGLSSHVTNKNSDLQLAAS